MNQNFSTAIAMLPSLIQSAEAIFTAPSSGAEKAASVLAAVAPLVPPEKQAQVSSWMNLLVSLYSLHGLFSRAPAAEVPVA